MDQHYGAEATQWLNAVRGSMPWIVNTSTAFLHIPKNAGSAIEDAARREGIPWARWVDWAPFLCNGSPRTRRGCNTTRSHTPMCVFSVGQRACPCFHTPIDTLENDGPYRGKHVFCVVREPHDRMVSQYTWLVQHPSRLARLPQNQRSASSALRYTARGLNEYLQLQLSKYEVVWEPQREGFFEDSNLRLSTAHVTCSHTLYSHAVLLTPSVRNAKPSSRTTVRSCRCIRATDA